VPRAPAHAATVPVLDPQGMVAFHLKMMKQQWAPTLLVAIVRGLRARLFIDPRITPDAFSLFERAVEATFDAATVKLIKAK
jgi:hypothetical protein